MAAAYVWCYRVAVTPEHLNRYWPFKLRDLPETKNLLIPEIPDRLPGKSEEPRSERYYPGKVFDDYERDKWNLGEYRRKYLAGIQNSIPTYRPSELQNAATDVDLFAIEMMRNANDPAAPDSPEPDLTNSPNPRYPTSDRG